MHHEWRARVCTLLQRTPPHSSIAAAAHASAVPQVSLARASCGYSSDANNDGSVHLAQANMAYRMTGQTGSLCYMAPEVLPVPCIQCWLMHSFSLVFKVGTACSSGTTRVTREHACCAVQVYLHFKSERCDG